MAIVIWVLRAHGNAEVGGWVSVLPVLVGTAGKAGEGVVVAEVARWTGGQAGVVGLVTEGVVGAPQLAGQRRVVGVVPFGAGTAAGKIETIKVQH